MVRRGCRSKCGNSSRSIRTICWSRITAPSPFPISSCQFGLSQGTGHVTQIQSPYTLLLVLGVGWGMGVISSRETIVVNKRVRYP
ncbi:hypothetical protein CDAR_18281 [Caerostris darwini]|uniref:Uncharacterized protein n=1 Tax=Caerostris darwini TaxID=1538125 RepID=A0AAV4V924_9ARAC|nr:hypothetical protein CDAR_18281 [Caerostris darwini]